MVPIIFTFVLIIALVFSVAVAVKKRKKAGIIGIKSALTSICFYLIAIINLLAYWFNFLGVINWSITIGLLLLGAYFTKYMPEFKR